jgi:hypothetical protein
VRLRLRELSGSSVLRSRTATVTGNGAWQRLAVTSAATSGGTSLSVEVLVSLTTALRADVDDVTLTRS